MHVFYKKVHLVDLHIGNIENGISKFSNAQGNRSDRFIEYGAKDANLGGSYFR